MAKVKSAAVKTHERVWNCRSGTITMKGLKARSRMCRISVTALLGRIAGGAFLKKFAEGYPWVHLDIAGTAWGMKGSSYIP